ncbi:MAG TPA: tRNA 2-thiouridine(34) synthase MnmA [Syntrophorhabdales bacterium]|nr:tRNA 2-thiouridine(34) synthase MnmA [Syntrophorhabdales bacterium]
MIYSIPVKTVFVAMSGGIDSSYSAYLLKERGYRVIGFTFDLLPASLRNACNPKTCCSAVNTERARRVADNLSIPHYVMNMREDFERLVIERFVDEYRAGRTPNPCILCNRHIKFASFLRKAEAMGADLVATGHYASTKETRSGIELRKGRDRGKDQSYFLYPIRRSDLGTIIFPLADLTKEEVRKEFGAMATENGDTQESQDICFIPENDYRGFVGRFIPLKKGPIVTNDGHLIGYHEGVHLYTIGQRRGIGIPSKGALYVIDINTPDNVITVGTRENLLRKRIVADDVNMLSSARAGEARAKVRYRQKEEACSYAVKGDVLEVVFHEPISSVTPGQSVVLYDGERVLGGATIRETFVD